MTFPQFILDLGYTLLETSQGLFDFLLKEFTIFGNVFSVYELLFGSALFLILGWILASWIIDIAP